MRIIADAYIPFLKGLLDDVAQVEYLSPAEFTAEAVRDADALIIRTRAKCNKALLSGSKVRFIATATIGTTISTPNIVKKTALSGQTAQVAMPIA